MGKKSTHNHAKVKAKPRGGKRFVADPRVHAQSRITTGKDLLPTVDGRSHWARIMRGALDALIAHCGGAAVISETKRMMARRAACLETELVYLENQFATIRAAGGEPALATVEVYGRLAGNQRRITEALGWDRTSRDITPPNPLDYARTFAARKAAEVEDLAEDLEEI